MKSSLRNSIFCGSGAPCPMPFEKATLNLEPETRERLQLLIHGHTECSEPDGERS